MCRTKEYHPKNNFLHLKTISLRFSLSSNSTKFISLLPEYLTFVFLPRINNTLLKINGSKFLPDSPAFLSLHRNLIDSNNDVVFSSNDSVSVTNGVNFEVHLGNKKFLRGVFRKHDVNGLTMECRSLLEKNELFGVKEIEVFATAQNDVVLKEKVVVKKKRFCMKQFDMKLEDILEERECDVDDDVEREGECCCCGEVETGSNGGDDFDDIDDQTMEIDMDMEGVRWAVDVGIWVVSLGVGFLVCKASTRNLMKKKKLFV